MKNVTMTFEIDLPETVKTDLHELLCLAIHEGDETALQVLKTYTANIIEEPTFDPNADTPHMHIWPSFDGTNYPDDPDEELDFVHSDTYDDHFQYTASLSDGRSLELRIFKQPPATK